MNRGLVGALSFSVTFTLLAGCGGSQPPISAPGVVVVASGMVRSQESVALLRLHLDAVI